jgi:hypothetical protein
MRIVTNVQSRKPQVRIARTAVIDLVADHPLEVVEAVLPPELRHGRFKAPDAPIASLMDASSPLI